MKKKLILIEAEMTRAKGHFLDYLIETSNYFKERNDIIWFLNKKFQSQNLYIPSFCTIKKIFISNYFKRKQNKLFYLLVILTISNMIFFIKFPFAYAFMCG